jgi:cell division septum initiation protein DivIVA
MRVEQANTAFNPVTITLDSQHEVDTFLEVLNAAYSSTDSNSDAERMADQMRDLVRGGGWQSSSYNC